MSVLASARTHLESLVGTYADAEGVGADDYDAQPRWHAMAEAKHLSALTSMRRSGLISASEHGRRVERAVRRLGAGRVAARPPASAWGLGFAYGAAAEDEPYTITTAQVAVALLEAIPLLPAEDRAPALALADGAVQWLAQQCPVVEVDGVQVPVYSPENPRPIHNATAYWAHALALAERAGTRTGRDPVSVARLLLGRAVPDVGWTYDGASPRADLLHTCYVVLALLVVLPAHEDLSAQADGLGLTACTQFLDSSGLRDHFDVVPTEAVVDRPTSWERRPTRVAGRWALAGFGTPARPWSVGELLVVAAAAADRPSVGPVWRAQLRWLTQHAVEVSGPSTPFRHTMHVAHGMARALEVLRAG